MIFVYFSALAAFVYDTTLGVKVQMGWKPYSESGRFRKAEIELCFDVTLMGHQS